MECNKDEAIRAKEIAQRKMQNNDFVGARKLVIKSQHLYPKLQNLFRMLTVCDVHCSAEQKVGSNIDWYGILQIEDTATDASIKKRYRKLALLLHPDKNKSPGAEAAFELVRKAHDLLVDPNKRNVYDITRRDFLIAASQRNFQTQPSSNVSAKKEPGVQANSVNTGAGQAPNMKPRNFQPQPSSNVNAKKEPGVQNNFVNTGSGWVPNMKPRSFQPQPSSYVNAKKEPGVQANSVNIGAGQAPNMKQRNFQPQPSSNVYAKKEPGVENNFVNTGSGWVPNMKPRNFQPQPSSNVNVKKEPGVQANYVNTGAGQVPNMKPQQQKQQQQTQSGFEPVQQTPWTAWCSYCNVRYQYYRDAVKKAVSCRRAEGKSYSQKKDVPHQNGHKMGSEKGERL